MDRGKNAANPRTLWLKSVPQMKDELDVRKCGKFNRNLLRAGTSPGMILPSILTGILHTGCFLLLVKTLNSDGVFSAAIR